MLTVRVLCLLRHKRYNITVFFTTLLLPPRKDKALIRQLYVSHIGEEIISINSWEYKIHEIRIISSFVRTDVDLTFRERCLA